MEWLTRASLVDLFCETARCVGAEMGANLPAVDLGCGVHTLSIAAGARHSCVILVRSYRKRVSIQNFLAIKFTSQHDLY